MVFLRRATPVLIVAGVLQLVVVDEAAAYLEPGSIQFFFQMLVGAIIGAMVTLRIYWHRIVTAVRGYRSGGSRVKETDPDPSGSES